jgi:surface carbohydrate biosynthesis protein
MDILIPLEIGSRETLYKTYLCNLLTLSGFTCYLGTKRNIWKLVRKFDKYIYLDKGYHMGVSDKIYKIIKEREGIIVSLDDEGAIDYPDNSTIKERYAKTLFSKSDLVLMWGKEQKEVVFSNISDSTKVLVTGHPRFELLRKEYRLFYQDDVKSIEKLYSNFILINTNMGLGNNINGDEYISRTYRERTPNIDQLIDFNKKKLDVFVNLIIKLSNESGKTIVLRPHPEENRQYYTNAFKGLSNVHITYEGSVIPWILACEIMIHPDCTTGVESLLLGKKSISFLPKTYNVNHVTKLPLEASYKFSSSNDVVEFIKKLTFKDEEVDISNYPLIEDNFSFSKNSTQLIVDKISLYLIDPSLKKCNQISLRDNLELRYKSLRGKLQFKSGSLRRNKLKGFNQKELNRLQKLIGKINPGCKKIKVKKLNDGLFHFSN